MSDHPKSEEAFDLISSLQQQMELLQMTDDICEQLKVVEEVRNAPLFTASVKQAVETLSEEMGEGEALPSFGLLAGRLFKISDHCSDVEGQVGNDALEEDIRVFMNSNTPWSAFICGAQGSGKSHSLSCMLENCLIPDVRLGTLPRPLAALVFHYDQFNSIMGGQPCEAAYLTSAGVKVRVLCALSNLPAMQEIYGNLNKDIVVSPLLIEARHLDVESFLTLMAANTADGAPQPLYMQSVLQVLREMAYRPEQKGGIDYEYFKREISTKKLSDGQLGPLRLRLDLLESFIIDKRRKIAPGNKAKGADWTPKSGQLTIIDLSCPFVDADTACGLFDICLNVFLAQKMHVGRVVALDEAHKFMTSSSAAVKLTEKLKTVIRLQRHLACRIIIATQEPTISPSLLDLCSITLIHRFNSPSWFQTLKGHLAAVSHDEHNTPSEDAFPSDGAGNEVATIFAQIVELSVGEAILCAPSAVLRVVRQRNDQSKGKLTLRKVGIRLLKVKMRQRISTDGGRSILAV